VIKGDRLYGRGGADDGYAIFGSLTAIMALQRQGVLGFYAETIGQASCVPTRVARGIDVTRPTGRIAASSRPSRDGHRQRTPERHAPGAEVVVRVSREDELAVFEVDDAGPGVAPEQREALFDRFARAGEARRKDRSGLGLGLPIAREVARRHGGDCTLEESPSGGLRARLAVRSS
jgi:hypothetical protein